LALPIPFTRGEGGELFLHVRREPSMPKAEVTVASGDDLSVRSFRVDEGVSRLFEISVRVLSPNASIDLEAVVGQPAELTLDSGLFGNVAFPLGGRRRWAGVCNHIEQVQAETTGLSTYELKIVPDLWLLSQKRNNRIFQHRSAPEIATALLAEWGVPCELAVDSGRYPKLEYRVQYAESDFDFLSRLLQEEGIAFYFDDTMGTGARLVLADDLHLKGQRPSLPFQYLDKPDASLSLEWVTNVRLTHDVRPGAHVIRDYDFRRPRFPLFGEATKAEAPEDRYEQFHYRPGRFIVEDVDKAGDTPVADDQGVARHNDKAGVAIAERALRAERVQKRKVSFVCNSVNVVPGMTCNIAGHPHAQLAADRRLLVVGVSLHGKHDVEWGVDVDAVYADVPFEPAPSVLKPVVNGVESATVVGPSNSEIHTDEFGRVRLRFPWDREATGDDRSSLWVRVSQGWAGTGFGMIAVPRVGQEVLVGFLAGDPDQPVVVGRVFNAKNLVPYKLPDHKTRSTWKSQSTPNAEGFNELMFEDLAGQELVWMQAQKNLRKLVKQDELITIGHDRTKLVKGSETEITGADRTELVEGERTEITVGNRKIVVGSSHAKLVRFDSIERVEGDRVQFVGRDEHILVQGERIEKVEKDSHLHVLGSRVEEIDGSHGISTGSHDEVCGGNFGIGAGKSYHVKAGSKVVIEAPDITLKGGGGFVRIDAGGVTIQGTIVRINSGGGAGSATDAGGGKAKEPREALIAEPARPVVDDLSKTGIGQ
jgi:type VI secretion system secreted protein VgrG